MISHTRFRTDVPIAILGDVVEFLDSKRKPITESERVSGPYPYYGANGIQDSVADWIFDEELVLLAEDGGHFENPDRGVAYKITGRSWVNNHAHVLRPTNKVHIDYLNHVLKNMDLMPYITGSTRLKLNKSSAERIKIPLPPLAEQQRIAAILDKAEEIKRKRLQAIEKLDQLAQSTFVEMFGDALAGTGKSKPILFESVTSRITYGFTSPMRHIEKGIPILTAKNIKNGYIDLNNLHYADPNQFDALTDKSKPIKGDVLITKDGTIGRTALVETDETYCINQSVALVRLKKDLVVPQYIVGYLTTNSAQTAMKNMSKGNALAHLQITELAKFPIPLPTLEIQKKYSNFIGKINIQKNNAHAELLFINALINSLQHQAFTTGFNA